MDMTSPGKVQFLQRMEPWGNGEGRLGGEWNGKEGGWGWAVVMRRLWTKSRHGQVSSPPTSRTVIQNVFTRLVAPYSLGWRWEVSWNRGPGACFKWEKVNRTWLTDLNKSHQESCGNRVYQAHENKRQHLQCSDSEQGGSCMSPGLF